MASPASAAEREFLIRNGDLLPAFSAKGTDGLLWASSDAAPVKIVFVFSCESAVCAQALPALEEFVWKPLRERGAVVLGIARDASDEQARQFAAQYHVTFPLVADPDRAVAKLFAADGLGVPRVLITDGESRIVYQHAGFTPGREGEYRLVAEAILDGEDVPTFGAGGGPGVGGGTSAAAKDVLGQKAPEFHIEKWITTEPTIQEGQWVIYEFWATWCGPCQEAMPHMQKLAGKYSAKLVIISISDEDEETVKDFVRSGKLTYPIGIDTKGRMKDALEIRGIPHCIVVDPGGIVRWQGHPMSLGEDGKVLDKLLGGTE